MKNIINFDVLIVYTESIAVSASVENGPQMPFLVGSKNESYNNVYAYFLEKCKELGIKAALSTSADIVGAGMCGSFWTYKNKHWVKNDESCFSSLIFDKFSPTKKNIRENRKLLFSTSEIKPFNDPFLFEMFFDKLKTYEELADFSIPTVGIESRTKDGLENTCKKLRDILSVYDKNEDFGEIMVMKDRFGAGGRHVYMIKEGEENKMLGILKRHPKVSFVLQPFAKFEKGFTYLNRSAPTDIRLIFLGGVLIQSYIRVAKSGDFRCNEHAGGSLTYIPLKDIPDNLVVRAFSLAKLLNRPSSLYALDFIVSNNGNVYLLEGNTGPGLDWNESIKKNSWEAKKLIRSVVNELVNRKIEKDAGLQIGRYILEPYTSERGLVFPLVA